jgi:hypothetical protein
MAEWLLAIDIKTVAMESTGIYWVPLYEILVERGIEVFLVNARHAKNVPGRKTDISDSQWLQQLHSYGLVRASFQPVPIQGGIHVAASLPPLTALVSLLVSH